MLSIRSRIRPHLHLLKIVLPLLLPALCAAAAGATTWFVDGAAAEASDANPGTEAAPWKTVARAAAAAAPGDVVVVRPFAYDQKVTVERSGTADAPITFRADPARRARLLGFVLQGDYIAVEGFEITSDAKDACGISAGQAHLKSARTGCRMTNNFIHDLSGTAIEAGLAAVVRGNLMRRVHRGVFVNSGTLVEGNEVDTLVSWEQKAANGQARLKKTQYAFFAGDDIIFRCNYFHGCPMERMKVWGVDFFTTWDAWIIGSSHRILIENNRCFNATHASEPMAEQHAGSSHITYRNNLFVNTVFVGILCKQWSHVTVENNTLINCGAYPVWFQTPRETQGSAVRNNLIAYWKHGRRVHGGPKAETGIANFAVRKDPAATLVCEGNMMWNTGNAGLDESDFIAEPRFFDPDGGDFRLQAGSPGIDAAMTLKGFDADLRGVKRPQGKGWDLGAFEMRPGETPATSATPATPTSR